MIKNDVKVTVLTEPIPTSIFRSILRYAKRKLIFFLRWISTFKKIEPNYGGHPAVTRSLIEGLQKLKVNFNYNPVFFNQVGKKVCVLANVEALKDAIEWKKNKRIEFLAAGPNLMVLSNEFDRILADDSIDFCLVPSQWVAVAYVEDEPILQKKVKVWFAGVDSEFWSPSNSNTDKDKTALLYWKTESENFCNQVKNKLIEYGWKIIQLKYGSYTQNEFKQKLNLCKIAVFISRSESQGIALVESWSMDVPTLVWNPQQLTYQNRVYSTVSACPYLTETTGLEWVTIAELDKLLDNLEINLSSFRPRQWVLENMTDECSAKELLRILSISN